VILCFSTRVIPFLPIRRPYFDLIYHRLDPVQDGFGSGFAFEGETGTCMCLVQGLQQQG